MMPSLIPNWTNMMPPSLIHDLPIDSLIGVALSTNPKKDFLDLNDLPKQE